MKHVTHRLFEHDGAFFPQYWNAVEERWMYLRHSNGQYIVAMSLEQAFTLLKDILETEKNAGNEVIYRGPEQFSLYISIKGFRSKNTPVGFSKREALQAYERQRKAMLATPDCRGYLALYGLSDSPLQAETIGTW